MQSQTFDDLTTLNSSMMSNPSLTNRTFTVIRNPQNSADLPVEGILPSFVSRQGSSDKDVEIFYAQTDQSAKTLEELKLTEIDYLSQEGKTVTLPIDCRNLKLALRFFQEASSNLFKFRILYTFTLKSEKDQKKAIVKQSIQKSFKIASQSPFKIDWEVKNADPFIQNLKVRNHELQLNHMVAPSDEEFWVNCLITS